MKQENNEAGEGENEMKIREAKLTDKKIIDKFIRKEWNIFNKEHGFQWKEKRYSFIALKEKEIVGILLCKIIGGSSYISDFIVKRELRNQKIGEELFNKFEQFSKKKGCHVIYLETTEKHKKAIRFYKKRGFKKIATLKKNKHKLNCYFFEKRLK